MNNVALRHIRVRIAAGRENAAHEAGIEGSTVAQGVLVGKPDGRRPPGRPTHRQEDNIKMDLREVGCGGMDWISVA